MPSISSRAPLFAAFAISTIKLRTFLKTSSIVSPYFFSQEYAPSCLWFDFDDLFDLLSSLEGWLRIKAIFHTNQGWITFNFNPAQLNYKTGQANTDNRIEIITPLSQDWLAFEQALLACRCNEDDQE